MDKISILDIGWRSSLMAAVCFSVLLSVLYLLRRDNERRASLFLAGMLVLTVISMTPQVIGFAGFYAVWPRLSFAPFSTEWFIGPLIYLHAYTLMSAEPLRWRKWLLLPGIIQTSYYLSVYLYYPEIEPMWAYNNAIHEPYVLPTETAVSVLLLIQAFTGVFLLLRRYRHFLEHSQSAAVEFNPVWIRNLMVLGLFAVLLYFGLELYQLVFERLRYTTAFPVQVVIMLAMAWVGLDAVAHLNVPYPKMPQNDSGESAGDVASDAESDWNEQAELLTTQVLDHEWFLEPRLSIRELARRLNSNETYLSRTLNLGLSKSFNRFINELRVTHARKLLRETDAMILQVALESGFNSKATFNRVFKSIAGVTPSQFKTSQDQ